MIRSYKLRIATGNNAVLALSEVFNHYYPVKTPLSEACNFGRLCP